MAENFSGIYSGEFEKVAEAIRQEALDEARELVSSLDILLGDIRKDMELIEEFASQARHTCLSLYKQADTAGLRLAAMPSTRNIPLALITSLDDDNDQLKFLPESTPIIHKGPSFCDDLFLI